MKPEDVKKEQELNEEELEGATGGKMDDNNIIHNTLQPELDNGAQQCDVTKL